MAYIKQFLTQTRPDDNTSIFRYYPSVDSSNLEIYSLISISNDVKAESARFNKFVWDGFLDGFLQKEGDVITRLKNALIGAEFKLRELIKHDDLLEEKGVTLDLSAVVFNGNKAYVALLGDHRILLYTKKVADISDLLTSNKSSVGSLRMLPGDMLLFGHPSKSLDVNYRGEQDLEDYLADLFDNEKAQGGAFVALLEDEKKEESIDTVPPIADTSLEAEVDGSEEIVDDLQEEEVVSDIMEDEKPLSVDDDFDTTEVKSKGGFFVNKVKPFLANLATKIKQGKQKVIAQKSERGVGNIKPIKVGGYREKELKRRRFMIFGLFLILLLTLFFGVKSGIDSREGRILSAEVEEYILDLEEKLERAGRSESEEALRTLSSIESDLESYLLELEDEGKKEKLFDEVLEKIVALEEGILVVKDRVLKIQPISEADANLEMFLDTRIAFGEKSNPVDMTITKPSQLGLGEYIYIVDQGEKAVFEVSLQTSIARKIGDPDNLLVSPMLVDLGNNPDDMALYVYDSEVGVLVARKDSDGKFNNFKLLSGLSSRSLGGDKIEAFAVFGPTDNLNFLIPSEGRITRAQSFGIDNYGLPSEFIADPAFESGYDLFGDQYIYVLTTLPNGVKRFVPITGLSSQILLSGNFDDLYMGPGYTGNTMDRVFIVLDTNTNRFIYFEKPIDVGAELLHPGVLLLLRQFEYRGDRGDVFQDVRNVVLEHEDKFMFVLDEMKVWKVNIQFN